MRLLTLISWPYLRKHAMRSCLTVLGIVLGVAVFVAMHTANQAVFFAFERTVDRIAGVVLGFEALLVEAVVLLEDIEDRQRRAEHDRRDRHGDEQLDEREALLRAYERHPHFDPRNVDSVRFASTAVTQ